MSKNLDQTKFGYAVELDKTVVHSESSSEPYGDCRKLVRTLSYLFLKTLNIQM